MAPSLSGADNLLRSPKDSKSDSSHERTSAESNASKQFILDSVTYQQQYSDIYFLRLAQLKKVLDKAAKEQWLNYEMAGEKAQPVPRVLDVRQGQLCFVSGTIFMEMKNKPNILSDLVKESAHEVTEVPKSYADPDTDEITIEDASGRIRLIGGPIKAAGVTTGCVIAILGSETASGDFEVIDYLFPEMPPQAEPQGERKGKSVLLASGLNLSGSQPLSPAHCLLQEYLVGELGGPTTQKEAANITHLILAGNSLAPAVQAIDPKKDKKYGYDASAYDPTRTQALDDFLGDILPTINTTVLPGATDPANISYPQQPLHPALLSESRRFSSLSLATNPFIGEIGGVKFLGTSGENVDDLRRYHVDGKANSVSILERCLRWRCIAPTCPDTLWSYPFTTKDPFVLNDCPHIIFAGNQESFESEMLEGADGQKVLAIALPDFNATGECVRVDLETFETEVLRFGIR